MKKNYITPNTEMTTWASMGLMQENPVIGLASGSGAGTPSTDSKDFID